MARGPNGEKRPAEVIANAVLVGKIATGEVEELHVSATRNGGLKGAKTRAESLTSGRRREIAQKAAAARWSQPGR